MAVERLRPVPAYRIKLILGVTLLFMLIAGFSGGMAWIIANEEASVQVARVVLLWMLGVNGALYLLSLLLAVAYYPTLEYVVDVDEVIVRAGFVTRSVKHVPYRTVTNLKVRRDPLDRLLGIGTLQIQTAGMSGQSGAEESLTGLDDVDRVYSMVAASLRQFRNAMDATAAGVGAETADSLVPQLLQEVRGIRSLLEQRQA